MMLRYGKYVFSLRNSRCFSSAASSEITPISTFVTTEANPINHDVHHEGRFYTISEPVKKQLFTHGGLPRSFMTMVTTLNELSLMVRKPSLEIIKYLKEANYEDPVLRYVLYGKTGTGKSITLAHVLHYGMNAGYLLVHVPWVPNWFRRFKEVVPSVLHPNKYDHPFESAEWIKHFNSQNSGLLKDLDARFSQICRTLVVIDGYNGFFSPKTRALREDKSVILPSEFVLTEAFLSVTKNDWNNAAVVLSVDSTAHPGELRESHLPRYLLNKEGFEAVDPFIPVEVSNYTEKEIHSQIDYYIDRQWLQQPKAHTEQGRAELRFTSGFHPYTLMQLVAPY
uniref:Small ribosomal subunit protein mS29 n=1 Tax=Evadne anonyx TaxID=141404 RepID=A0A9N6WUN4_9CRUS|nr:EOG090X05V1 [Evadne anonyx]